MNTVLLLFYPCPKHQTVNTMRGLLLLFFCVLLATSVNAQRYTGGRYSRVRLPPPTRYRQYHPGRSSQQQGVVAPDSTHRQPANGKLGKQEAVRRYPLHGYIRSSSSTTSVSELRRMNQSIITTDH